MAGKIELHFAPAFRQLTRDFRKAYAHLLQETGQTFYLVRDAERATCLKEQYFLQQENRLAGDMPFLPVAKFYRLLIEKLNVDAILLPFERRLLLLHRIMHRKQNTADFFRNEGQPLQDQTVRGLLRFFDEVRLHDATDLLERKDSAPVLTSASARFLEEVTRVYREYREALGEHFWDEADLLHRSMKFITGEFLNTFFPELKTLVWEDVSRFRPRHWQFVAHLKDLGLTVHLLLCYGTNSQIFSAKDNLFNQLSKLADRVQEYPEQPKLSDALFRLGENTFSLSPKISISSAADRLREVEGVAGEIKRIAIDKNLRLSEIMVSSPQTERYRGLLETVFRRHGLPFTFQGARLLGESLFVQHFLSLARLAENGYPLKTIQHLLKSPFFEFRSRLPGGGYIKILAAFRVRSGRESILQHLEKGESFYAPLFGENSGQRDAVKMYRKLQQVVKQLLKQAHFFEQSHTAAEYYQFISGLLKEHGIAEHLLEAAEADKLTSAEENIAAMSCFLEELFSWQAQAERSGAAAIRPEEFSQVLNLITGTATYRVRRPRKFGIQIVPFSQLANRKAQAVFVLGMEDGMFPADEPRFFVQSGVVPPNLQAFLPREKLSAQRELFLQLLHLPAQAVHFSYPLYHKDNPVLPSLFLRELERISDQPLVRERTVRLFSPADLLQILAQSASGEGSFRVDAAAVPQNLRPMLNQKMVEQLNFRLQVEAQRRNLQQSSAWEGNLSSDAVAAAWLHNVYRSAVFSVTQLETYARCPILFFLQRVLRVEPVEEAGEYLTPLDRGLAVHNILFRFYREVPEANRTADALLKIAAQELERLPLQRGILWQLEKEDLLGSPEHPGLLENFWRYEQEISAHFTTRPRHFEFSFGNPLESPQSSDPDSTLQPFTWKADDEEFRLKGKVDRVEIGDGGELLIVDYKTGHFPGVKEMWEGESLQLPLYLKTLQELLAHKYPGLEMAGAAYYSVGKEIEKRVVFSDADKVITAGDDKAVKISLQLPGEKFLVGTTPATLQDFVARSFQFAAQYIRGMRNGQFPHTLNKDHCQKWGSPGCPYRALCRVGWGRQGERGKADEARRQ